MQSEIMSHFNGLFHGKNRRKDKGLSHASSMDNLSINGLLGEKFRRKSEAVLEVERKSKNKLNSTNWNSGLNLLRQAKMDIKLNLKKLSGANDSPPALPVRHFMPDTAEELPPPIPERKNSLDLILDNDFQSRFTFKPISTVPLPEEFTGCKKIYPSKTPRRHAIRPPTQPPPPPPPPADDTPTFHLYRAESWDSRYDFEDDEDEFPLAPPPPAKDARRASVDSRREDPSPSNVPDSRQKLLTISPPLPLPPRPPAKPKPVLKSFSPPSAEKLKLPDKPSKTNAKKQNQIPKPLVLKTTKSEPNLDLNSPTSPPPLPARPEHLMKQTTTQSYPKLPLKPKNGRPVPPAQMRRSQQSQPDPRAKGQPDPRAKGKPANRNRPLPSVPRPTSQNGAGRPKNGWAGQEYDPREEEGDLYDVMDSTQM
ncbi:WAS/WASL-interacting protein family member 1-like [Physella acuta]|uniref:WAS/WASL-interacting protein family member 1-like n=1 Tax=Physella acuta TaxID=109671 RepID=UPI0027DC2A5F|nr:WAS/WASL-interacting protein family member 1-like [Physella acuta]